MYDYKFILQTLQCILLRLKLLIDKVYEIVGFEVPLASFNGGLNCK